MPATQRIYKGTGMASLFDRQLLIHHHDALLGPQAVAHDRAYDLRNHTRIPMPVPLSLVPEQRECEYYSDARNAGIVQELRKRGHEALVVSVITFSTVI